MINESKNEAIKQYPETDTSHLYEALHLLQSINNAVEQGDLLDVLGKEIEKLQLFDAYLINLVDTHQENLICEKIRLPRGFQSIESTYLRYNFSLEGDFVNVEAYNNNRAIIIDADNIGQYQVHVRNRFERWKIHQLIVVPIPSTQDGTLVGTIMAFRQHENLDPKSEYKLRSLLGPFIPRLQASLKYSALKSRQIQVDQIASEQTRFLEFVTTINNLTSASEIYDTICQEFLRQLPFEHVSVMMREGNQIVCKNNTSLNKNIRELCAGWDEYLDNLVYELDIADGATPTVIRNNAHLLFPDVTQVLHLPMSDKDKQGLKTLESPRTFLFVPIRHNNQAIGVIWLISVTKTVPVSDEELKLVELLCEFIGTSIKNAEVYELVAKQKREIETLNASLEGRVIELSELAAKDELTDLYNFRSFELELERQIKACRKAPQKDLSLVILDIDHFKKFNDTHGHNAGNIVLAEVAGKIQEHARQEDVACRYGGEEFAVILPNCDLNGAKKFAERVRETVEQSTFESESGQLHVTVSIGYGCIKSEEQRQELFSRVDQALYRAKDNGRNCVVGAK